MLMVLKSNRFQVAGFSGSLYEFEVNSIYFSKMIDKISEDLSFN
jgi:hypothetical protein